MLGVTAALGSMRAREKQRMELPLDEVTKPLREAQEVVLDWAELWGMLYCWSGTSNVSA